jgi:hypothetical protein
MTEENKLEDAYKNTLCFTYEVTMMVQVLAPDKEVADLKLDRDGGYISERNVVLKNSIILYKDGSVVENVLPFDKKKDK